VRYHFLTDVRFGPDGDFSYEGMVTRYNADLANNFGNLASRVLNMAVSYCDGRAPEARADGPLAAAAARAFDEATRHAEHLDFSAALFSIWELIRAANSFIEEQEPWKLHKAGAADAVEGVLGVEGPGCLVTDLDARWADAAQRQAILAAARTVEAEPNMTGASHHTLVVGRK